MNNCERCGKSFNCTANQKTPCWCFAIDGKPQIPTQYKDCLCPECLAHFANSNHANDGSGLVEGSDYYFEKGLMVFTEKFHLDRGHCCQSGCRHCPYGLRT